MRTVRTAFAAAHIPEACSVRVTRWGTDPHHRGAYSLLPPGALAACGFEALQRPLCEGRVWFAGEATHERYSGYLQGAWLSGRETADRIANLLKLS